MRLVWGLIAAFAVMVLGFWSSFFSNPLQNDTLHLIHGILAAGWMLILILQAFLMSRGHLTLHHWIGRLSPLWVAALVYTAVRIVLFSLASSGPNALPVPWRPILTWIDIPSVTLFAVFYGAAIWCAFRRHIDLHYRFMIATVLMVFSPALARAVAPVFHGLLPSLHPTFLIIEAVCLALIIYDYVRFKKIYAPYPLSLAVLVATELTMFSAPHIEPYMQMLRAIGYIG